MPQQSKSNCTRIVSHAMSEASMWPPPPTAVASSSYTDVIGTPLCQRNGMAIERPFGTCPLAAAKLRECDAMSPLDVLDVVGPAPFADAGRAVAFQGLNVSGVGIGLSPARRDAVVRLLEDLAVRLGDADVPPLPCQVLRSQFRSWIERHVEPEWAATPDGVIASIVYEAAFGSLAELRANGGCCSSGGKS